MTKLILSIKDYLIVCFGAHGAIPSASLDLCDWIKSQYPLLTTDEVLIVTACLIRSLKVMHNLYPLQEAELNKAVHALITDRLIAEYKKVKSTLALK